MEITTSADADFIIRVIESAKAESNKQVNKALVTNIDNPPVITIPSTMTKKEAAKELIRQHEEEESLITFSRSFGEWEWQDALVAIQVTAEKYFGWIDAKQDFMKPPQEVQVIIDYENGEPVKRTCFFGIFKIAQLDNAECTISNRGGIQLGFEAKKKHKPHIEAWFELIDQQLRHHSIYKGKTVRITDPHEEGECFFEIIEHKVNHKMCFNEKEASVLKNHCMLDLREKGKRVYLFYGDYGTGKTEAAMILGSEAKKLDMIFFYCKDSSLFDQLLSKVANQYSPALIFMEDIDEIGSGEDRTEKINELLNTLDGVETKAKDIKVIVTTNHEQKINPALRRPGRIDLILKFEIPNQRTIAEIFEKYFHGIEGADGLDYQMIAEQTPPCSGAFIVEMCNRAIRNARFEGELTQDIVLGAINSMRDHLELMSYKEEQRNQYEVAWKALTADFGTVNAVTKQEVQGLEAGTRQQVASYAGGLSKLIDDRFTELIKELKKKGAIGLTA